MTKIDALAVRITNWIGSPSSLLVHSILFISIFALRLLQISLEDILLILTTIVSLEAIYLAIFIQMTVNRHTQRLEEVTEDIEEVQENIEEMQEDIEELVVDERK
jgi:low affinity Fe/Cu permease